MTTITQEPGQQQPTPTASGSGGKVDRASRAELTTWLRQVALEADRGAFACLFRHFYPLLIRYMMHRGVTPAEAEDLVQETMVRVWLKARRYRPEVAAPSTWIFTVARNVRCDRARKVDAREGQRFVPADTDCGQCEPQEERVEAWAILDRLDELSHEQGAILRLVYLDGLSQTEISERLCLPLGTVKSRIRLAFNKLRRNLGIDS